VAEPMTLAAVSAVVLTEGVRFLYQQAGELLKRVRARRDAKARTGAGPDAAVPAGSEPDAVAAAGSEPVDIALPTTAFAGQLRDPHLDRTVLTQIEPVLARHRLALNEYVEGIRSVEPGDAALCEHVDGLRTALEAVLGQRITFAGEQRAPSGMRVTIRVQDLVGNVTGVRAERLEGGAVVDIDVTRAEGDVIGADVKEIRR
jgi:hypothetical protein